MDPKATEATVRHLDALRPFFAMQAGPAMEAR
jgi:hypothetical protein